jgi:hypothetical protein
VTLQRLRVINPAAAIVTASLAVTFWYAIARGQDFNWDQQNYHIGVPFLLAHDTFWSSVTPAGIQSYFNPYVLQAQFLGMTVLPAVIFTLVLAALQATGFMIAGFVCLRLARDAVTGEAGQGAATWLGLTGFALCLMSPLALSEAGSTFIDLITAVPIVGAYALLLCHPRRTGAAALAAGLLLGAATALKLTNGVFAFGVPGFELAGPESGRARLRMLVLCALGALAAFLVVGGPWHLALWQRFGNPFFPYYNNILHSPDFPPVAIRDPRFLPRTPLDIWIYPLYWLLGGSPNPGLQSPTAEPHFIDARWSVIIFGGTAYLAALALFPAWRRRQLAARATGLFLAIIITYLVWLAEFSIQRYLVPTELLAGAAVLFLALQIPRPLLRLPLTAGFALLCWILLAVPNWGHLPWRSHWASINARPLDIGPGPALVFLTMKPSSYVVASLPADARYAGINGDFDLGGSARTSLVRQLDAMLAENPPLRLVEVDPGAVPGLAAEVLASHGLEVTPRCRPLDVASERFRVCDVKRVR